jgi:hypothetical protein
MKSRRFHLAMAMSALVLTGTASVAHAETTKTMSQPQIGFTTRDTMTPAANEWGLQGGRKSMQWDASKGRWGLKFDMEQPAFRDLAPKDVLQAGAYYKLTPSLRVGGVAALGDNRNLAKDMAPLQPAPRVRLETTFKF